MTVKLLFTAILPDAQRQRDCVKTSRQVYLLCRWERHVAGFPHLGVIARWPATSKRVHYSALIVLSWWEDKFAA